MSQVVRITDETFARLQNLAEPFIDTPSSVIEKLLDIYEGRSIVKKIDPALGEKELIASEEYGSQNLFLAPAIIENFNKTIVTPFALNDISDLLTEEDTKYLTDNAAYVNGLHCWAMTESNRKKFNAMSKGDIVLFTVKNTGKFQCYGEVLFKTENEDLGNYIWNIVPNKPWKLIFFLTNIKMIDLNKAQLVTELGYDKNFVVPGFARLNEIKINLILSRYPSFQSFIESMEGKPVPTSDDFGNALNKILDFNHKEGKEYVDVNAGNLHRIVGGYPGRNHRMPVCCEVMKKNMRINDEIIEQPPGGKGASLAIRYTLPR